MVYGLAVKRKKRRRRLSGPIHDRIEVLRKAKDLSQEDLAVAVGVDKTAVSHWENRVARPDMSRLPALAEALGVTVDELIDGERAA